ncbi:Spy0128 family protein [Bacillus sp. T3]|uniref:DUF7601 domain-containing protein n=1 Tax=Bacillus sp. T3 TaxID=467262 RepID=UPI002981C1AA|nr:FctA domain-containing protein [Bacillus sp. T3]
MKKLLVMILALTFVLSMSFGNFAQATEPADMTSINIPKFFKLTNDDTISPVETFNFNIEKFDVTDSQYTFANMPMFSQTTFSIPFIEHEADFDGDTNNFTLNLPTYEHVGIFTYKITETAGTTAGVTYDGNPLYLTVTVINGSNGLIRQVTSLYYLDNNIKLKAQNFKNTFSARELAITKEVTGNLGQKDRAFEVTITLTAPTGKDISKVPVTYSGGEYTTPQTVTFTNGEAVVKFNIKHGDTITFNNLPYGVKYDVVETAPGDGYDPAGYAFSDNLNKIDSVQDTVKITNNKTKQVETGINLDSLPYIIILVAAGGGLVLFMRRRISDRH